MSLGSCQEDIRSGSIDGRDVQDIIIDAGSAASIVAMDMLPRNPQYQGHTWLAGFDSSPKKYQTVKIPLMLGSQEYTATIAVVPRETLGGNSALVGRNVPGLTLKQTICKSSEEEKSPTNLATPENTQPVMAVQTRAQKAKEEEIRAQEDRQTEELESLSPLYRRKQWTQSLTIPKMKKRKMGKMHPPTN